MGTLRMEVDIKPRCDDDRPERGTGDGHAARCGDAFGAIIIVALVALPFLARNILALPDCDAARVQNLTKTTIAKTLKESGIRAMGLTLSEFETVSSAADGSSRICRFRATWGNEDHMLYLGLTWNNREIGEYQLELGSSIDVVSP